MIIKLNPQREEVWRYPGKVIRRGRNAILIEAFFNREDFIFEGITLKKGDRFVEAYFNDRWYNIFEIHDRADGVLKGWYCNITTPAEFEDASIRYVDLTLDLLVYPDGRQKLLDEDEFAALSLDEATRRRARQAVGEVRNLFEREGFRLA